jgi:hypothetical protein
VSVFSCREGGLTRIDNPPESVPDSNKFLAQLAEEQVGKSDLLEN